jgi:hypothetical protein
VKKNMSCPDYKKLCKRLVLTTSVTFTGGNLVLALPAGTYTNNEKYCIVVAQAIPDTVTINAPVVVTIGTDTTTYPLIGKDCRQVTACAINTRTRYSTCVRTDVSGGSFILTGKLPCSRCIEYAPSLPIPTDTTF